MDHKLLSVVAAATLFAAPLFAWAQGAGEAAPGQARGAGEAAPGHAHIILENVKGLLENPFLCDLDLAVDIPEDEAGGSGAGKIAWSDSRHFAFSIEVEFAEGEQDVQVSLNLVADGEFVYAGVSQQGQHQVMKVDARLVGALMGVEHMPEGMPPINRLPELIGEHYQLEKGDVDEDTRHWACVARDPEIEGPTAIALEFDKKTWFPQRIHATGASGESILVTASNLEFPDSIDPARFVFTIPEGVAVMDMTPVIQMSFPGLELEDEEEAIEIEEEEEAVEVEEGGGR